MEFTRFFHRGHWVSRSSFCIHWSRSTAPLVCSFLFSLLHLTRSNRALSAVLQNMMPEGILDVKALRAFRVLRPLRLVSGVPSNVHNASNSDSLFLSLRILNHVNVSNLFRSSSRVEFNSSSYGAFITYCPFSYICHYYLCDYWFRALFWQTACHML